MPRVTIQDISLTIAEFTRHAIEMYHSVADRVKSLEKEVLSIKEGIIKNKEDTKAEISKLEKDIFYFKLKDMQERIIFEKNLDELIDKKLKQKLSNPHGKLPEEESDTCRPKVTPEDVADFCNRMSRHSDSLQKEIGQKNRPTL